MSASHALTPVWVTLHRAISAHVDADDRDEFLDTVVTMENQHDAHDGKGAGDAYLERVIRSLTGSTKDDTREATFPEE